MKMDTEEVRRQLQTAGRKRQRARAEAVRQSQAIRLLAPTALALGMSKSEIARVAQITRPALDEMLRDSGAFAGAHAASRSGR
jgi:hypothetical protein